MIDKVTRRWHREDGQGLIELIIALTILSVGIGALVTVLTASALSLQRSDRKGTAVTLAEAQIELYRNLTYSDIRLDNSTVAAISGSDPYMTAHSSDSTIPSGTAAGQITTATPGTNACPAPLPAACLPIQTVTGPDHRQYRIDTYITSLTPKNSGGSQVGDPVKQVFVVVRDAAISTLPILARSASTFSAVDSANITGKAITAIDLSAAPKADLTNTAIPASSIVATLSGGTNPTGTIIFYVAQLSSAPSPPCNGASWTQLGTANVNGNGTYTPAAGFTPTSAGTYYWYATYSGDSQNNQKVSLCGGSMATMKVQGSKWSPSLAVSTTASTGITGTTISGSAITAALASSSGQTTANISFTVFGPQASAPTTCTSGGTSVGTVTPSGDGSYNPVSGFTPPSAGTYWWYASYPGDATNNAAASTCGSSMASTVVSNPPDTFGFSAIGSHTAGVSFTATITAQLWTGSTDTAYTGSKTLIFTGPASSPGGTAPSYPATVTFSSGVATGVSFTLYNAASTTLTATQGLMTGNSNSFNVAAGSTSKLAVTNPGSQTAGASFGTTVTATDSWGNTTSSYSGTKAITWTGPLSSPNSTAPSYTSAATSVPFVNGVGTAAGITLYNAASTTLTATATSGGYTGSSGSFTVGSGDAASFSFAAVGAQTAGTAFNATLTAKDAYGNVATGYTGSQTISWSGAATSPNGNAPSYPGSVTFSSGVGTASGITLYKAASTTLNASSGGVSGSSAAFSVGSAQVQLTINCAAVTKTNGSAYSLTISRSGTDAYGNADTNSGTAVTITANYSDNATGSHKGSVSPTSKSYGAGVTSGTFTVTNPNQSGKSVTIYATASSGYSQSANCTYTTT